MTPQKTLLSYYNAIIPDAQAWDSALSMPLPFTIWTNTLKTTAEQLKLSLEQGGFSLTPIPWHGSAFRINNPDQSIGKTWQYLAGLYHIQEEVSMLSGMILGPQPGDTVLDVCAAPGNKTAQMSVQMQNQGMLLANDRNYGRMRALGQISKRLGLMNISTTIYDGVCYPKLFNFFDKVMVDAPCSCEGTFRKSANKTVIPHRDRSIKMGHVQFDILRKAIKLCRPGGRILYSTCTFAPEENERVIDQVLTAFDGAVNVVPISLTDFQASPGILNWHGETFDASIKNTLRIWPHINNTGGFYVALLEKVDDGSGVKPHAMKSYPDDMPSEVQPYIKKLSDRFGFEPRFLEQFRYTHDSSRGVYCTNRDNRVPEKVNVDATGLFFMKTKITFPKLVTGAAMMLGQHAKKNVMTLSRAQLQQYYAREDIVCTEAQSHVCESTGYVVLLHEGHCVGMGLFFEPRGELGARVRSLFPKYL